MNRFLEAIGTLAVAVVLIVASPSVGGALEDDYHPPDCGASCL